MSKKFRVHHILCTSLYEGKGYSEGFCDNMSAVVCYLREHADEKLTLVAEPDIICKNCKWHKSDDTCGSDSNRVVEKDLRILSHLSLTLGAEYTYRELCRCMLEKITEEMFAESCGNCQWHKQGLCHYENLIAQLENVGNGRID